jgi:hypothetical protein
MYPWGCSSSGRTQAAAPSLSTPEGVSEGFSSPELRVEAYFATVPDVTEVVSAINYCLDIVQHLIVNFSQVVLSQPNGCKRHQISYTIPLSYLPTSDGNEGRERLSTEAVLLAIRGVLRAL